MAKAHPGHFKPGNPGRPKGSVNKVNQSMREAFALAFERIGGVDALSDWGRENPNLFYPLASKLIPQELTGANGSPLVGVVVLPAPNMPT